MTIVVVSGGFDPVHSGHVLMFNSAKTMGDYLIVGINSDAWLTRKKGRPFVSWDERRAVVGNLKAVDEVMAFNDDDGTSIDLLEQVKIKYTEHDIIYANGGDRKAGNVPETVVAGVRCVFGVGGDNKANSSSTILQEWKAPKTERQWGYYRVLHEVSGTKVKELTVDPGKSLSNQLHYNRSEYWIVTEGKCMVKLEGQLPREMSKHETVRISIEQYHRLYNPFSEPCKLVEIQYGTRCDEDDIKRINTE